MSVSVVNKSNFLGQILLCHTFIKQFMIHKYSVGSWSVEPTKCSKLSEMTMECRQYSGLWIAVSRHREWGPPSPWTELVQAACVRCHETKCPLLTALFLFISSSFFLSFFLSTSLTFLPEGFIVGFWSHHKNTIWG